MHVKVFDSLPLHCRNYNQDTDEEEDEEDSEEEDSEEDEEYEEENDYKAMGHSCEYRREKMKSRFHKIVSARRRLTTGVLVLSIHHIFISEPKPKTSHIFDHLRWFWKKRGSSMLKAGNEKNADGEFQSPSLLSVCCDGARLRSLKPRLTPASLTVCGRMIPSVSSSQHVSH